MLDRDILTWSQGLVVIAAALLVLCGLSALRERTVTAAGSGDGYITSEVLSPPQSDAANPAMPAPCGGTPAAITLMDATAMRAAYVVLRADLQQKRSQGILTPEQYQAQLRDTESAFQRVMSRPLPISTDGASAPVRVEVSARDLLPLEKGQSFWGTLVAGPRPFMLTAAGSLLAAAALLRRRGTGH